MKITQNIIILDFGSQYSNLILKHILYLGLHAKIVPGSISIDKLDVTNLKGIILSGGPFSVYNINKKIIIDKKIFLLKIPILGICYGMQLISYIFGGRVKKGCKGEYGKTMFIRNNNLSSSLFHDIPYNFFVWMSHFDKLITMPKNFKVLGYTNYCIAAICNIKLQIYGLQFHPEVTNTQYGINILNNFIYKICGCLRQSYVYDFISSSILEIKKIVDDKKVILGFSNGIDSLVTYFLLEKAIGRDNIFCVFINTGLLSHYDNFKSINFFKKKFNITIEVVNAEYIFINALKNIIDPKKKRLIIGKLFVDIFQKEAKKKPNIFFLAQGTINSDVIESKDRKNGFSAIKYHHNVGGMPKKINLILLEPLKNLFKDEVKKIAKKLKISYNEFDHHPFPGPGYAIRIIGEVNKKKISILQQSDKIFITELKNRNIYNNISQAFTILLSSKSVGVMGDVRSYGYTIVLRAVNTVDFMTATFVKLPYDLIELVSNRIMNEILNVNRVVYDVSNKPPSTIEWE